MKLAIITSSRADWGLLEPLAIKMQQEPMLLCSLIVTGEHLTPRRDFPLEGRNVYMVECNLDSDSPTGVSKAMGLCQIGCADIYRQIEPDAVLCLGDRSELLASVLPAYIARIPILHLHGGELSGNYDNAFRYMVSKMASLHFVALHIYRMNLIKEGITPDNIHVVGALGCDGLKPFKGNRSNYLVCYHPNTLEDESWKELFEVLFERPEKKFFIMPNSDNGGKEIAEAIKFFCGYQVRQASYIENMSRELFIELLSTVKAIIGNSSSGIIEAPALATPTIDVGSRQKGRLRASSIINCEMKADSIREAFRKLESPEFQQSLNNIERPYKGENVAEKIIRVIKEKYV